MLCPTDEQVPVFLHSTQMGSTEKVVRQVNELMKENA